MTISDKFLSNKRKTALKVVIMAYYLFKLAATAGLIVLVSEIAKRSSFLGGLIASLPIISLLSIMWLYIDTGDTGKIAAFSHSVFWLVIPTLPFFVIFSFMLRKEVNFIEDTRSAPQEVCSGWSGGWQMDWSAALSLPGCTM